MEQKHLCNGDCAARAEPVDGIARRTFLMQSALMAAAAALAACGNSTGLGDSGTSLNGQSTITVSNYPSLANVGGVAMVSISGQPLAIVRTSATSFLALSRVCPHQGGIIGQISGGFECPVHGATFNINGQWVGGQRTSNMYSYATSYDSTTGVLTVG